MRLEEEDGGNLVVATLCLLEASSAGLLETELRQMLGNEMTLMPPSPFDEKGWFCHLCTYVDFYSFIRSPENFR